MVNEEKYKRILAENPEAIEILKLLDIKGKNIIVIRKNYSKESTLEDLPPDNAVGPSYSLCTRCVHNSEMSKSKILGKEAEKILDHLCVNGLISREPPKTYGLVQEELYALNGEFGGRKNNYKINVDLDKREKLHDILSQFQD